VQTGPGFEHSEVS